MCGVMTVALGTVLCGCGGPSDNADVPPPVTSTTATATAERSSTALFHFRDPAIVESSGIAASSYDDHLVFTHNDSGDTPRFFGVDFRGCTLARFNVSGATATDWEDMARSRGPSREPTLWLGDIG